MRNPERAEKKPKGEDLQKTLQTAETLFLCPLFEKH